MKEIIEITKDVQIPGTDIMLEAGDKIEILKEDYLDDREGIVYTLNFLAEYVERNMPYLEDGFSDRPAMKQKYEAKMKNLVRLVSDFEKAVKREVEK